MWKPIKALSHMEMLPGEYPAAPDGLHADPHQTSSRRKARTRGERRGCTSSCPTT